jgi:hypothetical protein
MGGGDTDDELIALLGRSGLPRAQAIHRLEAAGGNNRIYVVETDRGQMIAKRYFRSAHDDRDRRHAEWTFLQYAERIGLGCVPCPVATDPTAGITLCEHVAGRRPVASDIGAAQLQEAVRFFLALNGPDRHRLAGGLGNASEACFSIAEHVALVERRIARLASISPCTPVERDAVALADDLRRDWNRVRQHVEADPGPGFAQALPAEQRCVSPSDFGFHNALIRPDGTLCFLDFEYAGWDDPAKMVADFFCQPAVPVAKLHLDEFVHAVVSFAPERQALQERALALLPVIQIKWCCIMLNQFLPDAAKRRRFANPEADLERSKRAQIEKVRDVLGHMRDNAG